MRPTALLVLSMLGCKSRATDEELATSTADLQAQIDTLAEQLAEKDSEIATLQADLAALTDVVDQKADAESLVWLDDLHSVLYTEDNGDGTLTVVIEGGDFKVTEGNLYVQNGTGQTDGTVNGTGNLVIGYNEASEATSRLGSHNLVLGPYHGYSSYGGLIAGYGNTVESPYGSIAGGWGNTVPSGVAASVTGGTLNHATADYAVVSGGYNNSATGSASVVSGGEANTASAANAQVSGGWNNTASAAHSVVVGGGLNTAAGEKSVALSGYNSELSTTAEYATLMCLSNTTITLAQSCSE